MNMNIFQGLLQQNPGLKDNPMFQTILSGDQKKGEETARNLCSSYGVDPNEAAQQALAWARSNPAMKPILKSLGLS